MMLLLFETTRSICLSKDDGANWTGGLMLDERPGVSCPD
jgi:hypothetical protein